MYMRNLITLLLIAYVAAQDVRLDGGPVPSEGRVEVLYQQKWGSVCDDSWNSQACRVVCRQLGFTGGAVATTGNYGKCEGPIWLDDVTCTGDELKLTECMHGFWGSHDCTHSEDVGCVCDPTRVTTSTPNNSPKDAPTPGSPSRIGGKGSCDRSRHRIRPYNDNYPAIGRVEVQASDSTWQTVCDDFWDDVDAAVFCSCLGYTNSNAFRAYWSPQRSLSLPILPMGYRGVHCTRQDQANQVSLFDCRTQPHHGQCDAEKEAAGVACEPLPKHRLPEAPKVHLKCDPDWLHVWFNKAANGLNPRYLRTQPACHQVQTQATGGRLRYSIPLKECQASDLQADASYKHYCYDLHYTPLDKLSTSAPLMTGLAWSRQVCCSLAKNGTVDTLFSLSVPVAEKKAATTNSSFTIQCFADDMFSSPLSYPANVTKGQELFCKVQTETWDQRLFLVVPNCKFLAGNWDSPQFTFMRNRCPVAPALDLAYFNLDIHSWGFKFKVPKFHGYNNLLLSCSAYVCDSELDPKPYCDRSCGSKSKPRRKRAIRSALRSPLVYLEQGPFIVRDSANGPLLIHAGDQENASEHAPFEAVDSQVDVPASRPGGPPYNIHSLQGDGKLAQSKASVNHLHVIFAGLCLYLSSLTLL